ncbi:MAG: VOC family protein [Ilumatobacter sp.]|uniref:VOC family protein n=1 Tax=Ilumatobacter sp. TaxID=1967498 RepID=UPI003C75761F
MINAQDQFHMGIRVPDLDVAMDELGSGLNVTWAEPRDTAEQALWTPETGLQHHHLRYTYSAEGPQHLELLQGPTGSFWDGNDAPGAHHIGIWVDDVAAETSALVDAGWSLRGAQRDPSDGEGYGVFSYIAPPSGFLVELVDRSYESFFEQWWSAALDSD